MTHIPYNMPVNNKDSSWVTTDIMIISVRGIITMTGLGKLALAMPSLMTILSPIPISTMYNINLMS